jgi:pyrroloquinoline quinone biosynthesis protein D
MIPPTGPLRLAKRVRLKKDAVRGMVVLLAPEAVIELNAQGAEVLYLCDGTRTGEQITVEMQQRYGRKDVGASVRAFLERVLQRGWVEPAT